MASATNAWLSRKAHGRKYPAIRAQIWEHAGNKGWHEKHKFFMGLEYDREECALDQTICSLKSKTAVPGVHLPSMSLGALLQLRASLDRQGAVALDVEPGSDVQANLYRELQQQVAGALLGDARTELEDMLRKRLDTMHITGLSEIPHWPQTEFSLEAMMSPEHGAEVMDISVCPLEACDEDMKPVVALARLPKNSKVRYAALIVCPEEPGSDGAPQLLASEVGRALATTFMSEAFVHEMRRTPKANPRGVLTAFDHYLSTMTMVPTVHIGGSSLERPSVGSSSDMHQGGDYLLSDSLVDSMGKHICGLLELPLPRPPEGGGGTPKAALGEGPGGPGSRSGSKDWKPFYVEVDKLMTNTKSWRVTRCLRQGLELDISSGDTKPHLPHVSLTGLKQVRELVTPKSVVLDVVATCAQNALKVVVSQLVNAGLPASASECIQEALLNRVQYGAHARPSTKDADQVDVNQQNAVSAECKELVRPCNNDEACLILSIAGQIPLHHKIIGAFARLKSPMEVISKVSKAPARFLVVLVGPAKSEDELILVTDSLAALAVDEILMANLAAVGDVAAFKAAFDERLHNLMFMPQAQGTDGHAHDKKTKSLHGPDAKHGKHGGESAHDRRRALLAMMLKKMQKYSLPLIAGVLLAILWTNIDEHSYYDVTHTSIIPGMSWFGHDVSLHFLVNDIFMCFFFGLAIKEVTEALLPGGSLSPISRAANPLMATIGGIVGPVVVYLLTVVVLDGVGSFDGLMCADTSSGHRRLGGGTGASTAGSVTPCTLGVFLRGWGVPTATDISLAWMFAILIFGAGHPAINFLLLLAIVDDAIGMVIIAAFYGDPEKPVDPVWLLLVLVAMLVAYGLRWLRVNWWSVYVCVCGPISWLGLIRAHVHPALALVFVVPFMPAVHARMRRSLSEKHLGAASLSPGNSKQVNKVGAVVESLPMRLQRRSSVLAHAAALLEMVEAAPLHTFEHQMKLPVDIGMFFFGLANAGVKMGTVGGVTVAVVLAFFVGKTFGIAGFGLLAVRLGFGLPAGVSVRDLFTMSALGGVGLTVALFVANVAFTDATIRGQGKMGAVISVFSAGLAWLIKNVGGPGCNGRSERQASDPVIAITGDAGAESPNTSDDDDSEDEEIAREKDDEVLDDVLKVVMLQRKYARRGTGMPVDRVTRAVSKEHSAHRARTKERAMTKESSTGANLSPTGRQSSRTTTLNFVPGSQDRFQDRFQDRLSDRPPDRSAARCSTSC